MNDTATQFGGLQMLKTNCGRQAPLRYVSGLPYLHQRPPTKDEMIDNNIPHVIMTGDGVWNPRIVDDTESAEEMMKRLSPLLKKLRICFIQKLATSTTNILEIIIVPTQKQLN